MLRGAFYRVNAVVGYNVRDESSAAQRCAQCEWNQTNVMRCCVVVVQTAKETTEAAV